MTRNNDIALAVRRAIFMGAVAAASAMPVMAQDQDQDDSLAEVVVTGSRIASPNLESISPVASITAEDITNTGRVRIEDIINQLPQAFAAQGANLSNGSNGTATVNLRGLGSNRTLVLVNGRRLGPGDPSGNFASDINQIPASLIKRVDILTGGASSVYGADAVAGVVNFIMDTKFEGVGIDASYSFYNHKNDNSVAGVVSDAGFALPDSTVNTGYTRDFAFTLGSNFADDRGNAVFYGTYRNVDPILQASYDYSACTFNSGDEFSCGGSGTSFPARFRPRPLTGERPSYTLDASGANVAGNAPLYNFGPLNYFQRPDERYGAGMFLNYDVTEKANVYAEFMYMNDRSVSQIAPSGIFTQDYSLSCGHPLWSAAQRQAFCGDFGLTAADDITIRINRRNIEGGGRQQDLGHQSYRTLVGVRGDVTDAWKYDVSGQYQTAQISNVYLNDFSISRTGRALDVVDDGAGNAVCRSVLDGTDPTCVPYNIWSANGVTPAALNYVQIPLVSKGEVTERVISASVTGDLGSKGIKLASASEGLYVSLGAEWRSVATNFLPDASYQAGDGAGQGGATLPLSGGYRVWELFGEARLPILDNLSAEAGYRYSDYSNDFTTDTFKFGVDYAPIDSVKLRGTIQRAVRVPNASELFSIQQVALNGTVDPCTGPTPVLTQAQCANTGMTAAQYGNVDANPAAQYNGFIGGNPNLKPEEADTLSFGVAFQPSFLPNFRAQIDYYDIKIKDPIQNPNGDFTLLRCALTGAADLCSKVNRDADGSLFETNEGFVTDILENIGEIRSKGIDFDLNYAFEMGGMGKMRLGLLSTYLDSFTFTPQAGVSYDCVGLYGSICSSATPNGMPVSEWRHKFNASWSTPWRGLGLVMGIRHIGEIKRDFESSQESLAFLGQVTGALATDSTLGSRTYIDLSASMTFADKYTVRLGANNLLDKDPPLNGSSTCPTGPCNGNTWAQAYDSTGRQVFMSVNIEL